MCESSIKDTRLTEQDFEFGRCSAFEQDCFIRGCAACRGKVYA